MMSYLKYAFLLVIAFDAGAQVFNVTVAPPNPNTSNVVFLNLTANGCLYTPPVVQRTGTAIRVDTQSGICFLGALYNVPVNLGTLPAGQYTYQVFVNGLPDRSGSFAVAEVPGGATLSPAALAALVAAMAFAGFIVAARR